MLKVLANVPMRMKKISELIATEVGEQQYPLCVNFSTVLKRAYDIALVLRSIGYLEFERRCIWVDEQKRGQAFNPLYTHLVNLRVRCQDTQSRVAKKHSLVSKLRLIISALRKLSQRKYI
jgi:hypothetical protein